MSCTLLHSPVTGVSLLDVPNSAPWSDVRRHALSRRAVASCSQAASNILTFTLGIVVTTSIWRHRIWFLGCCGCCARPNIAALQHQATRGAVGIHDTKMLAYVQELNSHLAADAAHSMCRLPMSSPPSEAQRPPTRIPALTHGCAASCMTSTRPIPVTVSSRAHSSRSLAIRRCASPVAPRRAADHRAS